MGNCTAPEAPKASLPFELPTENEATDALADRIKDTSAMSPEPIKTLIKEVVSEPEPEPEEEIKAPEDKTGLFKKRGHVVKNWKERYFVLKGGLLSYYITSESPNNLKGGIEVNKYTYESTIPGMKNPSDGMAYFTCTGEPELLIDFNDADTKKIWVDLIALHAIYYKDKEEDGTKHSIARLTDLGDSKALGGLASSMVGAVTGAVTNITSDVAETETDSNVVSTTATEGTL